MLARIPEHHEHSSVSGLSYNATGQDRVCPAWTLTDHAKLVLVCKYSVYYTWQNDSGVPSRLPTTPLHFLRRRFFLPLTFLLVGSILDPFKHVRLVMHKHLAESAARRLDQMTVAFGRFSTCFDVVPNPVRMRDKD